MSGILRHCRLCDEMKPSSTEFFYRRKTREDGLDPYCSSCRRSMLAKHKETARFRETLEKTKERYRREGRPDRAAYNLRNKASISEKAKLKRQANLEEERRKEREWRKANPEAHREGHRRWRKSEKGRAYYSNPRIRLRNKMSQRLRMAIGGKNGVSIETIVGYTMEELRVHLERQFKGGMSWENYGEWHLDHILPLTSFKIREAGDDECRAAWALSNLRPLWSSDNVKKGATRVHLL